VAEMAVRDISGHNRRFVLDSAHQLNLRLR
jgi:hypothetical protein